MNPVDVPVDLTEIYQVIADIKVLIEAVISGTFLLSGVLVGVLMMCIFFFFLKGAE